VVDNTLLAPAVTLQFSISAFSSYLTREGAMVVVYPDWMPAPPIGQKPWVLYISYRFVLCSCRSYILKYASNMPPICLQYASNMPPIPLF
jgi:hypothetical protein